MIRYLFIAILISILNFGGQVMGQDTTFKSIYTLLKDHPQEDTIRVNLLNELSYDYRWIDFSLSQLYADQALKISKQISFAKGIATANYRLAHCNWALGDNGLSIQRGLEAAVIGEQLRSSVISGESAHVLARAYMDQREMKKAQTYVRKAEAIAWEAKNWDLLSRTYNLEGVILYLKNQPDSALIMYNKSLHLLSQYDMSKAHLSQVTSNIGECYSLNNVDLGLIYFKNALEIAKATETKNKSAEAAITGIIGHALIKKGNYREAESYLLTALRLSRQLGSKRSVRYDFAGLVDLKIREGRSAEALNYLRKYYDVHDSLLNVAKTRQIVELENKYVLEEKEYAIQLLERDREIQVLWTNILIVIVVFAGILLAILYYLQEYRDKKNRTILNLEIDRLATQHAELTQRYKNVLVSVDDKAIESSDQRLLRRAIEIIELNMKDPTFGVEEMAKEIGMSRTNMHRKIKAITGFPPSELIRNIRLRKAAELLRSKADSVSQISFTVGFEDHSYFSKSFKKQFGVAPSEYSQSIEQNELVN